MDWNYLFTSFEGRINRKPFWMGVLVLVVINIIAELLDAILHSPMIGQSGLISLIVGLILIYPSIALSAKRWHDRNKSAWWILIVIVPVIGWIWALIETGFLRGTEGENRFGPDPLATPATMPA